MVLSPTFNKLVSIVWVETKASYIQSFTLNVIKYVVVYFIHVKYSSVVYY